MTSVDNEIRHHALVGADSPWKKTIDTMHAHLDVVDAKTSVLLTFNGIVITIYAVLIGTSTIEDAIPIYDYIRLPLVLSAIGISSSTFLCLSSLDIIGAHSERDWNMKEYMIFTATICTARTKKYLWALNLTKYSCVLGILVFLACIYYV